MLDRFVRLTDNGWHPIPVLGGTKQPGFRGWTKHCREPMTTTRYRQLEGGGKGGSLGIACRLVIAVDIDVTDEILAKSVQELAQLMLGVTGLIRIGKSPKRIMVYRTAEPVNLPPFIGANSHRVEFLADGRQFVAFGKHPETGQDYRWIGDDGSPEDTPVDQLPIVTRAQLDYFRAALKAILGEPARKGPARASAHDNRSNPIQRDPATGQVIDGRDQYAFEVVRHVVNEACRAGHFREQAAIVRRGWAEFSNGADLARPREVDDKPWEPRHIAAKVRARLLDMSSNRIKPFRKSKGGEWTAARKARYVELVARDGAAVGTVKVLRVLMDDMNRDGRDQCYPSIKRVAELAGVSEATVHRAYRWLEERRYMTMKGVNHRTRTPYRVFDLLLVEDIGRPAARHVVKVPEAAEIITADGVTLSSNDTQNHKHGGIALSAANDNHTSTQQRDSRISGRPHERSDGSSGNRS